MAQTPEIAREEDFKNPEDDFRVIRLSKWFNGYTFTETFAFFNTAYQVNLQRVSDNKVEKYSMSVEDFNNMCEEWMKYKRDYEAFHGKMFPADFEKRKQEILSK